MLIFGEPISTQVKGQQISEGNFDVFTFQKKKQGKYFPDFCLTLPSKNLSNQKTNPL
jgi:hypothetical protein